MSKPKPTELFAIRTHANLSCLPESIVCYDDFESAMESVRDEIKQQDLDFPFYEEEEELGLLTEEQLKRWFSVVLASVIGEHALGGIVIAYADDRTIIDEWWDKETGEWRDL